MEYTIEDFKHTTGRVFTTSDGQLDTSTSNPKLTRNPLTLDACYLRHLDAREQVNCSTIFRGARGGGREFPNL